MDDGLTNATAIGYRANVRQSNSLVLGSINGVNGATSTVKVGIGTNVPLQRLHVEGAGIVSGSLVVGASVVSGLATLDVYGTIRLGQPEAIPTTQHLCLGAANRIAICPPPPTQSSIRYKQNINPFGTGVDLVRRLRPVSFNWKSNNSPDFGLIAEEVAEIEPLLVIRNDKREVEGVKYDHLGVVLINAVQEQQFEIEAQQKENRHQKQLISKQQTEINDLRRQLQQQQFLIEGLRRFACQSSSKAELCKEVSKNE